MRRRAKSASTGAAAMILSLYVLAALVGIGIVIGIVVVLEWPRVF